MSLEYQQEITLDFNTRSAPPVIYGAKQGDANTRTIKIHLTKDGVEYQITGDELIVLRGFKPDGTTIGNNGSVNLADNCVYITLTDQCLAVPGRILMDLLLYSNANEFLSTVSFILDVQPAPLQVMQRSASADEMQIFSQLLAQVSSIPSQVNAAQSAMVSAIAASNSAVAASNSAWAAVNSINDMGVIITPSSPLAPGSLPDTPSIFERINKNSFYYHAPTIKLKTSATVSVGELNVSANTYQPTAEEGEESNLLTGLNFDFTLPNLGALSTTFDSAAQGKPADAYAVGQLVASTTSQIPPSKIKTAQSTAIFDNNVLKPKYGGTGMAIDAGNNFVDAIGAQRYIHTTSVAFTSTSWANDSTATATINFGAGDYHGSIPEFIASPNNAASWSLAADAELYPPVAALGTHAQGADPTNWTLTWSCAAKPTTGTIDITVYWW